MDSGKTTLYRLLTVLAVIYLTTASLYAQQFNYPDAWGRDGMNLLEQKSSNVTISYSITGFSIIEEAINGKQMQNIVLSGSFLPNNEGMPNVPGISRYIAIPNGAAAVLKVTDYRTEKIEGVELAPAPRIPLETEDGLHFEANEQVYATDAFYPAEPIKLSEITTIRGVDAVMVGITPFQYNPVTKELIVYRDIQLEVIFEGGDGTFGRERLRSRWFDPIHQDIFLNSASLPEIDYNERRNEMMASKDAGCEYLIVIPNNPEFAQWADSIRTFRQQQGILTDIVTLAEIGGTTPAALETYFNNAYNTWDIPPVAILLMADYGSNAASTITSPIYNNYCVSDNMFADVTGNHMPDMIFARITANNAAQLQVMVSKFLNYERTPPTSASFYDHPITALGWQTERWFQICSETVGGFWRNQGKTPVRINEIYSGSPGSIWSTATNTSTVVNYFGPNGRGYIPATPSELGGWSGGTATMVNNAINQGAFMLQHRDHGYELGWGEPNYSNSSINGLHNTDLTFVFSINCLTGKYNYGNECFTEKFHRFTYGGQNSGALGLIAASETSYSFVNDAFVWGMFDNMYPEFLPDYGMPVDERGLLPAFGNAAGKYFLQQSSWPYNVNNKQVTYHLFHHHGDAFLNVYSEVPQQLTVSHENTIVGGETAFYITADAGSFIALTVDGEIIGTGEGTGSPVAIEIIPQTMEVTVMVTITKQNYYRHTSEVEVMTLSAFAGDDATICEGATFTPSATAVNYQTVLWETSGDGAFNNASILSPDYTPGTQDYLNGSVVLTLHATADNNTVSDDMTLSFILIPLMSAKPVGETEFCIGTAETDYSTEGAVHADDYVWYLTPEEAGILMFDKTSATVNWNAEWYGVAGLTVMGANSCGEGEVSEMLMITVTGMPAIPEQPMGVADFCVGTYSTVYQTAAAANATNYTWELVPAEAGTLTADGLDAEVVWAEGYTGQAAVHVMSMNYCGESVYSEALNITINPMPVTPSQPTGEQQLCEDNTNTTYQITEAANAEAYQWELVPAEAGTITADGINAEVQWAEGFSGEAMIHVKSMNECGESDFSEAITVNIAPKPEVAPAIEGKVKVCLGTSENFSVGEILLATSCEWLLEPAEAGTLIEDGTSCQVTFGGTWVGNATIKVRGANDCGHGDWSEEFSFLVEDCTGISEKELISLKIYPNPSDGYFTLSLNARDIVNIRLVDTKGKLVYNENGVKINGSFSKMININNLSQGVYYLSITGTEINVTEKIIIQR
ncbi:MAG: T9SS type A sorting domain-containing protein [Bacteroidales bacterium]|nr:T9SS type A sorting domain-containing protein [Bacteroidales bacterium]